MASADDKSFQAKKKTVGDREDAQSSGEAQNDTAASAIDEDADGGPASKKPRG